MTDDEKTIEHIKQMSQKDMAYLWRYAPAGHPYFDTTKPFSKVFKVRFQELGEFTPAISKAIDRQGSDEGRGDENNQKHVS